MATVQIEGLGPEFENLNGSLEITRRLSDKVLAAFNHAYATGEDEVAEKLRAVLKMTEAKRPKTDKRTSYDAVRHADLWVGFVDARNKYNAVSARKNASKSDLDKALDTMKEAYRAWSEAYGSLCLSEVRMTETSTRSHILQPPLPRVLRAR